MDLHREHRRSKHEFFATSMLKVPTGKPGGHLGSEYMGCIKAKVGSCLEIWSWGARKEASEVILSVGNPTMMKTDSKENRHWTQMQ